MVDADLCKRQALNQRYLISFRPSLEIMTVVVWKRTFLLKESLLGGCGLLEKQSIRSLV